jgi:flagellar biosynthesis/type III secretory pathway M-ring protein FliF/YscJ
MEGLITDLPNTIYGWVVLFGFGVFTVIQLVLLVRRNDIKILRDSNNDLRSAIQDSERRISELTRAVENLEKEVKRLKENNTFLQEIVSKSLAVYFEVNPREVAKIANKITT